MDIFSSFFDSILVSPIMPWVGAILGGTLMLLTIPEILPLNSIFAGFIPSISSFF